MMPSTRCHTEPTRPTGLLTTLFQVEFKILLLTLKAIHQLSPPHLRDLLHVAPLSHTLTSSGTLQTLIRAQKRQLKTQLFNPYLLSSWDFNHIT